MNNQPTTSPVVEASPEQPSLLLVKTQKEAVAYIQDQGYQVKKSKFSDDVKAGLVAKSEHGFDKAALMAYVPPPSFWTDNNSKPKNPLAGFL